MTLLLDIDMSENYVDLCCILISHDGWGDQSTTSLRCQLDVGTYGILFVFLQFLIDLLTKFRQINMGEAMSSAGGDSVKSYLHDT